MNAKKETAPAKAKSGITTKDIVAQSEADTQVLVFLKNNEARCTSLDVADSFNKRHDNVMQAIEKIVEGLPKSKDTPKMFFKSSYIQEQNGQRYPMYEMNRDGFSLLVMGFTGKRALQWKLDYIKAFNQMESFIMEKKTDAWIETRQQGKLTRKAETDIIKEFIEYAKGQGSKNADKYYMVFSKLANKMVGVSNRDTASTIQLNNLSLIENIILNQIRTGIRLDKEYKVIYQDCKRQIELFKDVAYLEVTA